MPSNRLRIAQSRVQFSRRELLKGLKELGALCIEGTCARSDVLANRLACFRPCAPVPLPPLYFPSASPARVPSLSPCAIIRVHHPPRRSPPALMTCLSFVFVSLRTSPDPRAVAASTAVGETKTQGGGASWTRP